MLKIVYPICCGIDVHKHSITATIASTDCQNVTTYITKSFKTFTYDLLNCKAWLLINNCKDICMESTGKYWIPIFNILESSCNITLTHPKYVRSILGKKTDKKDSIWIADIFKHGLVQGSFMPPLEIRQLRDLMRYRFKLTNCRSSEKNRFQNSLTVSNVMLSSVVSDTFGKSSQSILQLMLSKNNVSLEDITPLLNKNLKSTPDEILKSIEGTITKEQNLKMKVCLNHFESISSCIKSIDDSILSLTLNYQNELQLILTVPGIKDISALTILSEIGADMSAFKSASHLCSWAGLTPQNNESANKKKSVKISRAGAYIKPTLIQCANCAIRSKECNYFKLRYEAIKKRRGHKRAIIAIARMLLTCIYHMLTKNESFNLETYSKLEQKHFKSKESKLNVNNAIKFLQSQGYSVTSLNSI